MPTKPTRRQSRIIHQLDAEIEALQVAYDHTSLDGGHGCRESLHLLEKKARYVALLATVQEAFELINNI